MNPAGHASGPFTLTGVKGAVSATLERNADYWGGKAKAPGVDVTFAADGTARANALRTKTVDIAEYVPIAQASLLGDSYVHEFPSARTNGLSLNTAHGVFADPTMRAAAREAIDSKALADGVYEGRADTAQGLLGPGIPWAAEKRATPGGRTKAASRAEVGRTKEITLATYTNRPELPEVATLVQQQLEKRGFTVKQVVRDYAQMEADALMRQVRRVHPGPQHPAGHRRSRLLPRIRLHLRRQLQHLPALRRAGRRRGGQGRLADRHRRPPQRRDDRRGRRPGRRRPRTPRPRALHPGLRRRPRRRRRTRPDGTHPHHRRHPRRVTG